MNVPWYIRDYPLTSPPEAFGPFADFVQLWRAKTGDARRDGRTLPAWGDFELMDLRPWWGRITLVEREEDTGQYRFALWGTKIADWSGKEITKHKVEDVFNNDHERIRVALDHLDYFFNNPVISFWKEVPTHFDRDYAFFEGMSVPLSRDGTSTTHMMTVNNRLEQDDAFWPSIPHVAAF